MRRRTLLSALVASASATATAGCSGFEDERRRDRETFGVGDTTEPERDGDDRGALGPVGYSQFEGTVATLPDAGHAIAVSPSGTGLQSARGLRFAFERDASAAGPATVRATLVNRSASAVVVDTAGIPAFEPRPAYWNGSGGAIAFAPTDDHPFATRSPTVRRSTNGTWTTPAVDDWLPRELELEGLERVTGRYALVGVEQLGPVSSGRYRLGEGDLGTAAYVWDLDAPGPASTSTLDARSLPSLGRFDRWFHEVTPTTEAWLEPTRERVKAPARVSFELVNHRRETLVGRDDRWQLYRLVDEAWYPLTWRTPVEFTDPLLPGERASWTLWIAHDGDVPMERDRWTRQFGHEGDVPTADGTVFPFLGGGTYAFASFYEDGFATAFELVAPTLELEPTPDVRSERDGDAVVVTHPDWSGNGHVFELRESDATPALTLVTEQVYRDPALRNALAFAGEAPVVRYRTPTLAASGPFDWSREDATFSYAGESYEMALVSVVDEQS